MTDISSILLLAVIAGVAVVAHRHFAHSVPACLIAPMATTPPSLVVFVFAGGLRTDFLPFTLFVLFVWSLMGSAIVGLPFVLTRWLRKQPMDFIALPTRVSWPMVG